MWTLDGLPLWLRLYGAAHRHRVVLPGDACGMVVMEAMLVIFPLAVVTLDGCPELCRRPLQRTPARPPAEAKSLHDPPDPRASGYVHFSSAG